MRLGMACLLASALVVSVSVSGCGGGSHPTPAPAPTVTSVTPVNGATNVAINAPTISATFSEPMTSSTLSTSTFTLTPAGGAAVTGTVSSVTLAATAVATFAPSSNLAYNTQYTATITTGAQSSGGTALAANYSWSFTTAAAPVVPTVTAVTPLNLAAGVALNTTVTAAFSQAMTSSTITSSTFTLAGPGGTAVPGTVAYASTGSVATFTPSANLAYSTLYTATITTGAQDSTGTALAANYTWTFTTAAAPVPPTVTAVTPTNNATAVAVSTTVTAAFSQPMTSSTITSSTFTVTGPGATAVPGTVTYAATGSIATFTPSSNLTDNTLYTATITTGAQDSTGTALAANYSWTFTTIVPANPPTVTAVTPANAATAVSVTSPLTATFSQSMSSSSINSGTFTLTATGGAPVTGTVTYNSSNLTATFTPSGSLAFNTQYMATLTTGVENAATTPLAAPYTWSFTTAASNPNTATVNFTDNLQTIDGFGGSTAWLGQMPTAVATALFSPTQGLGLSILRVRIDPEGTPSTTNPYETGEWDYEAANGGLAIANNPNAKVFATPWSPPAVWKLNGSATFTDPGSTTQYNESFNGSCGSEAADFCGGYLNPSHYADYANYLEDFVTFYNSQNTSNPLYAISMQNEPEENVNYESCIWSPDQMDAWVAGNASVITANATNPTKFIMPEADSFQPAQALVTLEDTNAEGFVSIVGGHIYGVTPAPYTIPAGDTPKEIWMTEYGPLSSAQLTWPQALTYAQTMHQALVTAQYNAYVWWGVFGDSTGSCATAAGTCGLVDNSGKPSTVGYVMGQYSKFIQPGYTHEGVTTSTGQSSSVLISAYTGTESGTQHYVVVATNMSTSAVTQTFNLQNGAVTSMTPWQSTSAAGLAQQSAITVTGGSFTYTLPAQSITSFVQ